MLIRLALSAASAALLTSFAPTQADAILPEAQSAIEEQAGCFEVTFEFEETFLRKADHKTRSQPYHAKVLEWVELEESSPGRVVLQHVLQTPHQPIKHWRQVWQRNPQTVFKFEGNGVWRKTPVAGFHGEDFWAQRVYQVDDGPRYECAAPWILSGSVRYWECSTWSPLPRREFSKRSDYNVLDRRNRHQIFDWGWRHEQDNRKLVVTEGPSTALAEEKGYNHYVRVDASRCKTARQWWQANNKAWKDIQAVWDEIYAEHEVIRLKANAEGAPLWQQLMTIAETAHRTDSVYDPATVRAQAREAIRRYLQN